VVVPVEVDVVMSIAIMHKQDFKELAAEAAVVVT
jgi:hypothetical protein